MPNIGQELIFLCLIQLTGGLILNNGARKRVNTKTSFLDHFSIFS